MNNSSINDLRKQYFGLSKTIRRLLISGILAAIYAVLDMAIIQPMMEEYSQVTKSIATAKAESKGFAAQLLNLKGAVGIDPSLSDKKQLEVASIMLTELENSIAEASSHFVSPKQMSQFMSDLIAPIGNLTLIGMENTAPDDIIITTTKETTVAAEETKKGGTAPPIFEIVGEDKIYKHRIRITLEGKYADIADYLKAIETMHWKIYWQKLELSTEHYPNSLITLEIYTLSLKKDWLTL